MRYNVLMFGFDSLSRNTFIRKLPKSYKVIKDELKAHILEGYFIIHFLLFYNYYPKCLHVYSFQL